MRVSDDELVAHARQGDRAAFGELVALDSTRLLGHAEVDVALGEAHLPN
jgi:hypothetical protein